MANHHITAIVLAGGQGKRMNSEVSKQYLLLEEKPVLYYALKVFEESFVDDVILVVPKGEEEYCQINIVDAYSFTKVKKIVEGGRERYHSVYNALTLIKKTDYVFIHDGARPFLTSDILQKAYESVVTYKACAVGMPVKDTIKIADDFQFSKNTPDRNRVWLIQTPQVFAFALIKKAYEELIIEEEKGSLKINITDDAMVVETFLGQKVKLVKGEYSNIKITTQEDLATAKVLIKLPL